MYKLFEQYSHLKVSMFLIFNPNPLTYNIWYVM